VPTVLPIRAKMKGAAITINLLFLEGISFSRMELAHSHCFADSEALFLMVSFESDNFVSSVAFLLVFSTITNG
jgi:hypothetical protein